MDIPQPPGSKKNPLIRKCRTVSPNSNPSLVIGIPKRIKELANISAGDTFWVYYDPDESGQVRIILQKT